MNNSQKIYKFLPSIHMSKDLRKSTKLAYSLAPGIKKRSQYNIFVICFENPIWQ